MIARMNILYPVVECQESESRPSLSEVCLSLLPGRPGSLAEYRSVHFPESEGNEIGNPGKACVDS